MKKIISSILAVAAFASATPAFAAAPVSYRSTRWFDSLVVDNGKKLDITGRVIARTIEKDIAKSQTYTVEGKAVTNYVAGGSNMERVKTHCDLSRRADELSYAECHYQNDIFKAYPTISY